jgi:hypothetical protein
MENKIIPFWIEGMNASERKQCICNLFAILGDHLINTNCIIGTPTDRTFVFVPDPPPIVLDERIYNLEVNKLLWGFKGQAVTTTSEQTARNLAPIMFDLWSDSLYVILFNNKTTDELLLKQWITMAIQKKLGVAADKKTDSNKIPNYSFLHFDWGDLIEYPNDAFNHLR